MEGSRLLYRSERSGGWHADRIDSTGDYGRVPLGSWCRGGAALKLGAAFHRSHMEPQASQVSDVPAAMSGRWNKARRFALAWEVLRRIKPSRMLGTQEEVPLRTTDVLAAHEATEKAEGLTCLIVPPRYHSTRKRGVRRRQRENVLDGEQTWFECYLYSYYQVRSFEVFSKCTVDSSQCQGAGTTRVLLHHGLG